MGKKTRRKYTPEEKLAAVIDSLKTNDLSGAAARAGVNVNLLAKWKKKLLSQGDEIFESKRGNNQYTNQTEVERLQRIIGKQAIQIDFLESVRKLMS